jgi:uncharacterized protein YbjT (DUF2867 family)
MDNKMKIVVVGGTGLIGKKLVTRLREQGHEAIAASPSAGINAVTGEGLADALVGAQIVVDVSNSPSFEDRPVMEFFETSTRHLLAAEAAAGVKHHIALSVVGTERLLESGYFRAKLTQEQLIQNSNIPYTIVRATQFFEFLDSLAYLQTVNGTVHLPPALFQPLAADDVAAALADVVNEEPVNGIIELAGPEPFPLNELLERYLKAKGDPRPVVKDTDSQYFGITVNDESLTPGDNPRLGDIRFEDWMNQQTA